MKNWLLVFSSVVILVLSGVLVSGCFGESAYPAYSYSIKINGLADFTNDNTTIILIPVPVLDDKPLFNSTEANSGSGDWSVTLVDTEHGKMLSLKTNRSNLSEINIEYTELILQDSSFSRQIEIINSSASAPLRPISSENSQYSVNQESTGNHRSLTYSAVNNYSSYVSIDKNIRPLMDNSTIEIILEYNLFRGISGGRGRGSDWAEVHEIIPAGVTGFIPVNTRIWSTAQ